jgi:uncharacterized repeat protein (TIGR03803 family)
VIPGAPNLTSQTAAREPRGAVSFQSLFAFHYTDGANPEAELIPLNGVFYSTTTAGGLSTNCSNRCGTVFVVTKSGSENVLHNFDGGNDGAYPNGGLIAVNGALYGTTSLGGGSGNCPSGCGTVFTVSTSGAERVLYSFKGGTDGAHPPAALIAVNGTLYGTTNSGGTGTNCPSGCGSVFKVSTSGVERVLYSFKGGTDGAYPQAGLIAVSGLLYGTTGFGGANNSGSVFKVSTSGAEHIVYSFKGGNDGIESTADLITVNGLLYGTTAFGGTGCVNGSGLSGCGTVFKVSTAGTERVLYRFKGGTDGAEPRAALVAANGVLYGTTLLGGDDVPNCGSSGKGCGTVFKVSTSGTERVLHRFTNGTDGALDQGSLVAVNGVLYGTTNSAGGGCGGFDGCGIVFALTP